MKQAKKNTKNNKAYFLRLKAISRNPRKTLRLKTLFLLSVSIEGCVVFWLGDLADRNASVADTFPNFLRIKIEENIMLMKMKNTGINDIK